VEEAKNLARFLAGDRVNYWKRSLRQENCTLCVDTIYKGKLR